MTEILPILQGLSTPVLLVVGWLVHKGNSAIHELDKRIAIVEYQLSEHRKTEGELPNEENFDPASSGFAG